MKENHKHVCLICEKDFDCVTSFGHNSEVTSNFVCDGDYESFCIDCPVEEQAKWCIEHGLIDDLPLTPENYGDNAYECLTREGLKHGSTWQ